MHSGLHEDLKRQILLTPYFITKCNRYWCKTTRQPFHAPLVHAVWNIWPARSSLAWYPVSRNCWSGSQTQKPLDRGCSCRLSNVRNEYRRIMLLTSLWLYVNILVSFTIKSWKLSNEFNIPPPQPETKLLRLLKLNWSQIVASLPWTFVIRIMRSVIEWDGTGEGCIYWSNNVRLLWVLNCKLITYLGFTDCKPRIEITK